MPGIRFAAIHGDYSYLLYPARWFPVSGYTSDRYTYELKITVPAGNRVDRQRDREERARRRRQD